MLTIISTHEARLSKAAEKRLWSVFLSEGSTHSSRASTLPYIIRRCEREGIPYTLQAWPGLGYFIKRADPELKGEIG